MQYVSPHIEMAITAAPQHRAPQLAEHMPFHSKKVVLLLYIMRRDSAASEGAFENRHHRVLYFYK